MEHKKPYQQVQSISTRPLDRNNRCHIRFVVAHEILGTPVDAAHNPRFSRMSHVYSHMFTNTPPVFKDMWGSYFFEAWALTLLILLQVRAHKTVESLLPSMLEYSEH